MYRGLIPGWRCLRDRIERARGPAPERSPADEQTTGFNRQALSQALSSSGLTAAEVLPVWYATGFLHAALETGSRFAGRGRPFAVPAWIERFSLGIDRLCERLPALRALNWNWTVIARKGQRHPAA
jgi:hypothetical protein